jgi:predicted nucleotidyltransferase
MNREDQILAWVAEGLNQFAGELKGYRVVLFGSRAAGTAGERSDFDLGILGESPVPLQTFYRIADFLEQLPTLFRIDWVDLNRATAAVRENAMREARVLYG